MAGTSLLFLGYRLADWNFRAICRAFSRVNLTGRHFSVQLLPVRPDASDEARERARLYLDRYLRDRMETRVYWGTCREFAAELRRRWGPLRDA